MMSSPSILRPYRLPLVPAALALVCAWFALTPSLLPRTAVFQGLLCAVAAGLGYALGALLAWVLRGLGLRLTETARRRARIALAVLAALGTAAVLVLAHGWQQEQRADIGMPEASAFDPPLALVIAIVVFLAIVVVARSIRAFGRWIGRAIARVLPLRVAAVLGTVVALVASYALVNSVIVGRLAERLDSVYLAINDDFRADVAPPSLAEVSGGPGSLVSWEDLGRQGRIFIANTPTRQQIAEFFGRNGIAIVTRSEGGPGVGPTTMPIAPGESVVRQPIRVYVGTGAEGLGLEEKAALAVEELVRTGAFDRAVLNVVTGTGRGWVNENQARALEYLWHGDTATVSVQYSYLPSWMSYLVDGDRPRRAGQALFEAVYAHWSELPESARPRLVVSGESLGSFGGEGAFSGAQDLAQRTDGALWVGPTANNLLWQRFTAERDPGSPVYLPTVDAGETVRFSADGEEWPGARSWDGARVGYLQHANDPVTWLDFGALFAPPEFLTEPRGPGVPRQMIWLPVLTVLQLAVDQLASGVPDGQGHEFGQAPAHAWAAILPPEGWDAGDSELLADELAALRTGDLGAS